MVPRPPGSIEKAKPGAERILSGMIAETLALARQSKGTQRRIVILDDDLDLPDLYRRILQQSLKDIDLQYFTTRITLHELRAVPDLFITDLNMPKMDGFQVLSILAENKVKFPVMMLTS